jgi:hypothetical protein
MQQPPGESPHQRHNPRALPRNLVDEAYALIPRCGDFASRLEQQEATVTYLSVWLGDGQPVTFYSPPEQYAPHGVRINCTVCKCAGLPWIIDRIYVHGLDRDYQFNRNTRRALNAINARTRFLDDHPELIHHPDDARTLPPRGPPR